MQLLRQTFCLILLGTGLSCRDATEPPAPLVSKLFLLESVNDRSLPTIVSAGAGDTTQVLWSSVTLDATGHALTVHHLSHVYLQYPAEDNTIALHQEYRIKGDSIEIGSFQPCPPGAMCVGNLHGELTDSTLAITEWYNPFPTDRVIYRYRLVQEY